MAERPSLGLRPEDLRPTGLARAQAAWRAGLSARVYGVPPPPPDAIEIARRPWGRGEIATLAMRREDRVAILDAGLWLPPARRGRVPLVVALAFLGPLGIAHEDGFPIDPDAVVEARLAGFPDGRLRPAMRGLHAGRWPLALFAESGVGLLCACYGSVAPDDPDRAFSHGAAPLTGVPDGPGRPGTIALWAWGLSRLLDAALTLPEVDPARIAFAGHSRLGKAALLAAALDERAAGVLACCAGCLGPRPAAIPGGETPAQLAARFPHWVTPAFAERPTMADLDQQHLLAAIAPRRLYVASASLDDWANPTGERAGLAAAAPAWRAAGLAVPEIDDEAPLEPGARIVAGPLAWHLRPGGHDLTPWDWARALPRLFPDREPAP